MEDVPEFNGTHNGGRDERGRFTEGNPGKPQGSARNKMRQEIKTFLTDKWPEFGQWFETLKPNEKVKAYMELLPFGVSKLQTVAIEPDKELKECELDFDKLSDDDLRTLVAIQEKCNR